LSEFFKTEFNRTKKILLSVRFVRIFAAFLLLFFVLSITGASFAQDKIRCELCGKTSWGKYWTYENGSYCDDCYKKYPHCYRCGIPVAQPISLDGENFCSDCYSNKLNTCSLCGKPVLKCWIKKDKYGNPLRYCHDCLLKVSDKCSLCGESLISRYWIVNSSINEGTHKYCLNCKNKAKKCFYCGLLAPLDSRPDYEGRIVCSICNRQLITRSTDYYPVFEKVRRNFKRLNLDVKCAPTLNIVGFKKLKKLGENVGYASGDKWGLFKCIKVIAGGDYDKRIYMKTADIFVLSRLPRDIAFYVITHEYAHAWYEERVVKSKGPVIDEGFAEWVSYHVLKDNGLDYLAEGLKNKKDVYGDGLRRLLEIERKRGSAGVLDFVLK